MEVFRISKCAFIHALDGLGAATYGGRWNSKGTSVIYTAGSRSLALLEALAHIERPPVGNFCRATIYIPDDSIQSYPADALPAAWREQPPPDALKAIGDAFVREEGALALRLPSVIVPDEANYLLNPTHPRFEEVKVLEMVGQVFDERLV